MGAGKGGLISSYATRCVPSPNTADPRRSVPASTRRPRDGLRGLDVIHTSKTQGPYPSFGSLPTPNVQARFPAPRAAMLEVPTLGYFSRRVQTERLLPVNGRDGVRGKDARTGWKERSTGQRSGRGCGWKRCGGEDRRGAEVRCFWGELAAVSTLLRGSSSSSD